MTIDSAPIHQLLDVELKDLSHAELEACCERLKRLRKKDLSQVIEDEALGRSEHQGFIYVLSNPAMQGLLKIGCTEGPVAKRIRELSKRTGVPDPFKLEGWFPVYVSLKEAEKSVHEDLGPFRWKKNREFFRLSAEYAIEAVRETLGRFQPNA